MTLRINCKPKEKPGRDTTTIAVDLAKSVFQIAVSDHPGYVSENHRLSSPGFVKFFAHRQANTVVLEACRNKDIHPVPVKSVDQHVLMSLHRFRYAYMARKTAPINADGFTPNEYAEQFREAKEIQESILLTGVVSG